MIEYEHTGKCGHCKEPSQDTPCVECEAELRWLMQQELETGADRCGERQ